MTATVYSIGCKCCEYHVYLFWPNTAYVHGLINIIIHIVDWTKYNKNLIKINKYLEN